SVALQCAVKHLALAKRIGSIILSVQDQSGRASILNVGHPRAPGEAFRLFIWQPVEPFVISRAVLGAKLRRKIAHPRTRDRSLESLRLSDGPGRHVSAIRPPADSEPVRICDSAADQQIYAGHYVFEVSAAPVAAIHLQEAMAIPGRAANVRIEHRIPS